MNIHIFHKAIQQAGVQTDHRISFSFWAKATERPECYFQLGILQGSFKFLWPRAMNTHISAGKALWALSLHQRNSTSLEAVILLSPLCHIWGKAELSGCSFLEDLLQGRLYFEHSYCTSLGTVVVLGFSPTRREQWNFLMLPRVPHHIPQASDRFPVHLPTQLKRCSKNYPKIQAVGWSSSKECRGCLRRQLSTV